MKPRAINGDDIVYSATVSAGMEFIIFGFAKMEAGAFPYGFTVEDWEPESLSYSTISPF